MKGESKILKKGDTYSIDKNVVHSAKIKKGYKDLTLFDQVDRFKQNRKTIKKKNIHYLTDEKGNISKLRPWFGGTFSFLYDIVMKKNIFPKKLNASISIHERILKKEFQNLRNANILEIATGSGNMAPFLNIDNKYTGVDISTGLLKKAFLRFKKYGFKNMELFNADACELPFSDNTFDLGICNLSLNFFDDLELVIHEIGRVLKQGSTFFCSIPIPERKPTSSKIRGKLYSENELKLLFEKYNFLFKSKRYRNGAILYFSAVLTEKK